MSQPVPPQSGNPFAEGPPGASNPYAQAPPPPAPARNNAGIGILAAVVAALVGAGVYGAISGAIEREIGFAAIGVGFLIGFAAAKAGGAHPALPAVSAALALPAICLGQIIGAAVMLSDFLKISFMKVLTENFSTLVDAWTESADFMTYVFLAIGAVTAFSTAKKGNALSL
ncbi:hypothetical protein [Streptomyces sp. CAU 1734]|uniref:hypothetical protein n=1 Tax=Streptomyces sp. CAU 1734 TaxID=3140360 RepID=UPI00326164DB